MAAVGLDGEQAGVGEFAQVAAGGSRADPGFGGQSAGGQCAAIVERQQDTAARRVGDQCPDRGDVGVAAGS